MAFFFGNRPDFVRECERLREIGKREFLLETMLVDDAPVAAEVFGEGEELVAFDGGDTTAAWDTFFIRESGRHACSFHIRGEFRRIDAMTKRFPAVDEDYRNVVRVLTAEIFIGVDVDFGDFDANT